MLIRKIWPTNWDKISRFVWSYSFPEKVRVSLVEAWPATRTDKYEKIEEGLKVYLLIHAARLHGLIEDTSIPMPSTAVDEGWHAFILCSRDYFSFCEKVYGEYLHHEPTAESDKNHTSPLTQVHPEIVKLRKLANKLHDKKLIDIKLTRDFVTMDWQMHIPEGWHITIDEWERAATLA